MALSEREDWFALQVDQLGADGSCYLDHAVLRCRIIRNKLIELQRFDARQWLDAIEPRITESVQTVECRLCPSRQRGLRGQRHANKHTARPKFSRHLVCQ